MEVCEVAEAALFFLVLGVRPDGPSGGRRRQVGQAGRGTCRAAERGGHGLSLREFHYLVNDSTRGEVPTFHRERYSRSKPRLMIVFWISLVPSRVSRSGASRIRRSISYSFE